MGLNISEPSFVFLQQVRRSSSINCKIIHLHIPADSRKSQPSHP